MLIYENRKALKRKRYDNTVPILMTDTETMLKYTDTTAIETVTQKCAIIAYVTQKCAIIA